MEVLRCSTTDCILIDGKPYLLSNIVERVYEALIKSSIVCSNRRIFHIYHFYPRMFYSGSKYGHILVMYSRGAEMSKIPDGFTPEFLPQSTLDTLTQHEIDFLTEGNQNEL